MPLASVNLVVKKDDDISVAPVQYINYAGEREVVKDPEIDAAADLSNMERR